MQRFDFWRQYFTLTTIEMSVHRQIALLLSILNTLLAVSHIYAMWKLLSANSYRRRQEMLVYIVTDSSNKINGIMKLLNTKKT